MENIDKKISSSLSNINALYVSVDFFEKINEQSCDCDKLIIKNGDTYILLTSKAIGEDAQIVFEEISPFDKARCMYEIKLDGMNFRFDKLCYLESGEIEGIRFAADGVFLFVFASERNLILTMSKYDIFEEIEMELPKTEARLTIIFKPLLI